MQLTTQTATHQLPTFTATCYSQGERTLVIAFDGQTKLLTDQHPHFSLIVGLFQDNPEVVLEDTQALLNRYINHESHPINHLLQELTEKGLPTTPITLFWEKLSNNPIFQDAELLDTDPTKSRAAWLLQNLKNKTLEIDWTGNLVLYTRPTWTSRPVDWYTDRWMDNQFVPLETVERKEPIPASTYDWVINGCPDQGMVYDIAVSPADILDIKFAEHRDFQKDTGTLVYFKRYQNLSRLAEKPSGDGISIISRAVDSVGKTILVRQPYNSETIRAYLQESLNLNFEAEQVADNQLSGSC